MVLRGSNIAPEQSLGQLTEAINVEKKNVEMKKEQLEMMEKSALDFLAERDLSELSKEQLVILVGRLTDRVRGLESEHDAAADRLADQRAAMFKTVQQLGCGGAAGAVARTTVAPIDRVKILMQTSHLTGNEAKYGSISKAARSILHDEGFRSFWRGNATNCVRVVPHTATQFVSYEKYKPLFVTEGQGMSIPQRLMAGALSGMTAASVTHPLDVVRIRLQTQPELKGAMDSVRSIYAENGLRTFYKGYTPAILSLAPFIAINFASFDTLKTMYYGDVKMTKKELQQRNPGVILGLGAAAGLFAQTCCYPLDTVRRRMQLKGVTYTSTPNAFATIARTEGLLGFYKGMSANALKVVPNNAIRFAAYEMLKSYIIEPEKTPESWGMRRVQRRKSLASSVA